MVVNCRIKIGYSLPVGRRDGKIIKGKIIEEGRGGDRKEAVERGGLFYPMVP